MIKVVTLNIDDTSLRLLVANGKRVENWGHLLLEPDLVKDGVIIDETKVAAKIKELMQTQQVNTKKVIVGLSGIRCLTRPIRLPKLSKTVLVEAIRREAERIVPVPLEQFYLAWQILSGNREELQVFLAALPRNTIDALVSTLRQADVEPYLIDIKPLALARVVDEVVAIIVDVQPTEFDIIIMADRVPQLIRTLSLPHDAQSWHDKLPIIKEDLDRTIKFYNSNYAQNPLDSSIPMLASGELAQATEACQSLADELKHPALPLLPPLYCPPDFPSNQYMANIGLALKKLSLGTRPYLSVVNLNALPEVYQPKAPSLTTILIGPGAAAAIGLLVYLITLVQGAAADTTSLQAQLDIANQLYTERQIQAKEITELEKKIGELEASRDTFTAVFNNFGSQQQIVNGDLDLATYALPSTMNLTSITHASSELTLKGMAPSETEVLSYAKQLRASGRFSQVIVSTIEKTENGVDFTLTLLIKG